MPEQANAASPSSAAVAAAVAAALVCIGGALAFLRPGGSTGDKTVEQSTRGGSATNGKAQAANGNSSTNGASNSSTNGASISSPKLAPKPNGANAAASGAAKAAQNGKTAVPAEPAPAAAASAVPAGGGGGAAVLARLRQERANHAADAKKRAAAEAKRLPVTFLFASQTGTAEEIAHSLYDEAAGHKLKASVNAMDDHKFDNISADKTPVLVVVAASTGDGDPPDNARRCILALKAATSASFKGMRFCVLGLGDSNYTKFMEVPRTIRRRLLDLGAEEFYESKDADEVDGLEDIVEAWSEGLWAPLAEAALPQIFAETYQYSELSNHKQVQEQIEAAPRPSQEGSKPGAEQPHAELPEDYTKSGKLVSADTVVQGVPALRMSRVDVMLGAASEQVNDRLQPTQEQLAHRDPEGAYSEDQPFWARLQESRLLTSSDCSKRVYHTTLDVSDAGMRFAAGDSFQVHPANSPKLVEALLKHLGADGAQKVEDVVWTDGAKGTQPLHHLKRGVTLRHNLLWAVDLTTPPSKAVLVALAAECSDEKHAATLRFLGSRDGRAAYKCDIAEGHPSVVQLLQRYDSCKPPVGRLLELLGPLRPRQYSLSNTCPPSTSDHGKAAAAQTLECAYKVVEYETHWGPHEGVATAWLEREGQAGKNGNAESSPVAYFPVSLRPTTGFRPPADASKPVVMIGPGTGVAPFRGFLQHRAAQAAAGARLGDSWLFFGNWRKDLDYIYQEDFEAFEKDGTLTHLVAAWSRETASKVYVQHKMKERGAELCKALHDNEGYVFVCGDGLHMATDVHNALREILQQHADFDADEADAFLKDLGAEKRYVKDVWM